jgi:hypothetical protein
MNNIFKAYTMPSFQEEKLAPFSNFLRGLFLRSSFFDVTLARLLLYLCQDKLI